MVHGKLENLKYILSSRSIYTSLIVLIRLKIQKNLATLKRDSIILFIFSPRNGLFDLVKTFAKILFTTGVN